MTNKYTDAEYHQQSQHHLNVSEKIPYMQPQVNKTHSNIKTEENSLLTFGGGLHRNGLTHIINCIYQEPQTFYEPLTATIFGSHLPRHH